MSESQSWDFVVLGSGAAGLTAALAASRGAGCRVLLLEKDGLVGGASARSGGWLWIPGHPLPGRRDWQAAADTDRARTYLAHCVGPRAIQPNIEMFLAKGPEMVGWVMREAGLPLRIVEGFPDYHASLPGAAGSGRSITVDPVDGREIGPEIDHLRPPLHVATVAGMMVGTIELQHFLRANRSRAAMAHVLRRAGRHARDLLQHRRTLHLANGNALVAKLYRACLDAGVTVVREANATRLVDDGAGRITGVDYSVHGQAMRAHARNGVLLATGGFAHDEHRRSQIAPAQLHDASAWGLMPSSQTGDGLRLSEPHGAVIGTDLKSSVALGPLTQLHTAYKGETLFPLLAGRQKPGVIAVDGAGRRFTNEADSYHDFGLAMLAHARPGQLPVVHVITDERGLRRYGFGFAKPFPFSLFMRPGPGYVISAASIRDLAARIGAEPATLERTLEQYNADAHAGRDTQFGRGGNAYNTAQGDPEQSPNPCVAPIERAPFHALRVTPAVLATFAGIRTNEHAQVLRAGGEPILGLYAAGNDMLSIFGGDYVGGGSTIGPGMTFGYVAAMHAAGAA